MGRQDQGVQRDRYMTIPRTLTFLTRGDQVLLIRGAPQKRIWANRYNGVGGHVERGEDILSSARREILEETGYRIREVWLAGVVTVDTGEQVGINFYIFRGECASDQLPLISAEGQPEWIPVERINDYPLVEDLPVILPRAIKTKKGDLPFFAQYRYDEADRLQIQFAN